MMEKQERLTKVYKFLKSKGICHTQKGFGERIGKTEGVISKALHGDEKSLTDNLFIAIFEAFKPMFSIEWLKYGKGEMLATPTVSVPSPAVSVANSAFGNSPNEPNSPIGSTSPLKPKENNEPTRHEQPIAENLKDGTLKGAKYHTAPDPEFLSEMYSKLKQEQEKLQVIRSDTEKANREVHSLLTSLNDDRKALQEARADFLSARHDLDSAVTVMRQLIARITNYTVFNDEYNNGIGYAAEDRYLDKRPDDEK